MNLKIKLPCLACVFLLLFTLLLPIVSAAEINEPDGDITGIANRGLWHEYPENSLEAVLAAAETGIDAVLADVSLTSDGVPVLMEKDSASRMLDGADRDAVSAYTLEELLSYFLKERSGGSNNGVSVYKTAKLSDALEAAKEKNVSLVLKTDVSAIPTVVTVLDGGENVILYVTGKTKDVKNVLAAYGDSYNIITEKRGNIVFVQTAFVDFVNENGGEGVVLKTTNRYGVNFNQTLLKHFYGKSRAIADTSDPTLAGAREDAEKWWNDLVSRGYSVIITNDPAGFAEYKSKNEAAREKLNTAFTEYTTEWKLPQFGSIIFNDYKKAYTDAVTEAQKLLGDKSSSTQDMIDCRAALIKACDDIDMNYEALEAGKAGMTVSAPRIGLCIGAVIVVVAVQIFFFKRREKA